MDELASRIVAANAQSLVVRAYLFAASIAALALNSIVTMLGLRLLTLVNINGDKTGVFASINQ